MLNRKGVIETSHRRIVFVLVFCFHSLHCGVSTISQNESQNHQVFMEVTNHNWSDAVIYVSRAASPESRTRLGEVPSMAVRNFVVPAEYVNGFSIFAHLIGKNSESYSSGTVRAEGGETLFLTIQENIMYSMLIVR